MSVLSIAHSADIATSATASFQGLNHLLNKGHHGEFFASEKSAPYSLEPLQQQNFLNHRDQVESDNRARTICEDFPRPVLSSDQKRFDIHEYDSSKK